MARYSAQIETTHAPEVVFDYIADFSTNAEWDPGTISARRLDSGPVGARSEFALHVEFLGRQTHITYRIVEYERPQVVTFRGENQSVVSLDRVTFEPLAQGTRITYDASIKPRGWMRIADPLLGIALRRAGARASARLREILSSPEFAARRD